MYFLICKPSESHSEGKIPFLLYTKARRMSSEYCDNAENGGGNGKSCADPPSQARAKAAPARPAVTPVPPSVNVFRNYPLRLRDYILAVRALRVLAQNEAHAFKKCAVRLRQPNHLPHFFIPYIHFSSSIPC
jgi:hypothetical protein